MEDGSNGLLPEVELPNNVTNGVACPVMTSFPDGNAADTNDEYVKVNGDAAPVTQSRQVEYSSESDALVIDEGVPKQKLKKRANKSVSVDSSSDVLPHFNPYFGESLFELSQQAHNNFMLNPQLQKHRRPTKKNSPKLREYAQYLGLQPTVQFKCSRCGRAGFESLTTLNQHIIHCTDEPLSQPEVQDSASSSFKLTRKVFLCSACGTYYENWNLYLHMLEVHKRHLCLYCLGMFSVLDDLCNHIQMRHSFEPGHKSSLEEFFTAHSEPCYIVCCDCGKLFSEQENFFYHSCAKRDVSKAAKFSSLRPLNKANLKPSKQQIRPEDHITGDSVCVPDAKGDDSLEEQNNVISQETLSPMISDKRFADTEEIENEEDLEIVYSTDSEQNFKGFDSAGEAVYSQKMDDFNQDLEQTELDGEVPIEFDEMSEQDLEEPRIETRKVPKLSLKLKPGSFPEIEQHEDDNENDIDMDMEEQGDEENYPVEQIESEEDTMNNTSTTKEEEEEDVNEKDDIQVAGAEVHVVELQLEQPLDKFDIRTLLQRCLNATASFCIYCNHARRIAVNGKQLGLHAIAQHRYSAVVSSITAEELIPESFVCRIKESLEELEGMFFNLESSSPEEAVTFTHIFECFQCHYATGVHKELYLHNRKMHAKNLLLCIMCKSSFYNYSELICHMCPGVYILDNDVQFKCCMCISDPLPSAFRLMVHLRKRHHVCDVCLEVCNNQYRLSNHVWKHKLHHFCYRCGIAYRNKPDITRHLFWKHGTESVLCKKCLQKKWPHVYHFCVPPTSFTCEECNLTFSKAVAVKVHRRIHTDDRRYACSIDDCQEKFISKKLLAKHENKHREPPKEEKVIEVNEGPDKNETPIEVTVDEHCNENIEKVEDKKSSVKPKIDVYDLPELNLSESDSSDSENETGNVQSSTLPTMTNEEVEETQQVIVEEGTGGEIFTAVESEILTDEQQKIAPTVEENVPSTNLEGNDTVIENIWDNFKNYQANKEKFDHLFTTDKEIFDDAKSPYNIVEDEAQLTSEVALHDHDYCASTKQQDVTFTEVKPELSQSIDHDYCYSKETEETKEAETEKENVNVNPEKPKSPGRSSSSSSSESDTSSCSCGSNCSCSSGSSSSSSSSESSDSDSSTAEGRKRQQARRERRRQKSSKNKNANVKNVERRPPDLVVDNKNLVPPSTLDIPIEESDLETTESDTDEEFYDREPQKLAKKILEEKRNLLLAGIEPTPNGSIFESSRAATPNLPEEPEPVRSKKKSKSKKKKKKKSGERRFDENKDDFETANVPTTVPYYKQYYPQPPTVAPITLSLPRNSVVQSPLAASNLLHSKITAADVPIQDDMADSSLRASKRRRVPNKFYGYSSDEEDDKAPPPKWRKQNETPSLPQHSSMVVPPITLKTSSSPAVVPHHQAKIQPFSIRATSLPGQMKVHPTKRIPPIRLKQSKIQQLEEVESEAESNDSNNEGRHLLNVNPDALYCYCKCPYDEVSEMIGCDASDCAIEWFHFECVGIMVPPKGHWYCPECRKKRQQKRELLKMKAKSMIT